MPVSSGQFFGLMANARFDEMSPNATLLGCFWIATFQLCLHSNSSRRTRTRHRGTSKQQPPGEIIATLKDSGEKLTLITMADSNRCTSAINITTFSELLHAQGDYAKISRVGRNIAKSTLTAYLRKKIDQLYALDAILMRREKFKHQSSDDLPRGHIPQFGKPYLHSGMYKTSWKLSLSYTILINFGFDGKSHILFSNSHWDEFGFDNVNPDCQVDEIYDPVNKKCRQVTCDVGFRFIDGYCQNVLGLDPANAFSASTEKNPVVEVDDGMTLIILQANVTLSDYITTLSTEFKPMMIESLSGLLNISAERIKNFTIEVMEDQEEVKRITFHKIPPKFFGVHINKVDGLFESSSRSEFGGSLNPRPYKTAATTTETRSTTTRTWIKSPEANDEDPFPNVPLEISFILVPLNKTSNGKSVSSIVEKMDSMVQNNEFTFNVNETSLRVVGLKNELEPTMLDAWCEHGLKRYYTSDQFSMIDVESPQGDGKQTEMIYINETDTLYGTGAFDLTIFVRSAIGQEKANISAFVFVCDSPKLKDKSCGRISLDKSEYKILPNMSVMFGQYIFGLDEYQRADDNGIVICIPSAMTSRAFKSKDCVNSNQDLVLAQIVLTLIFGVLSLVAMFAVVFTYILFPNLRNVPGINTMNLTIALFCAELIFLLFGSVDSDDVCTTVAISLHYFFLASFFWMNVMTYDLYCTFGRTNILPRPRDKTKVIPRYLIYAWGAPLLIVGACVAIDLTHVFPTVKIGYGLAGAAHVIFTGQQNNTGMNRNGTHSFVHDSAPRRLGCWIQDPLASLVAFGVPLISIVLVNAALFIRTIASIRKTIKTINLRISHPVSGKDDVVLYVRMSVVMGFTWVLGLASSLISSGAHPSYSICLLLNIVGLFFVIFNCSQGLFICFVFVLNRRVAGYYKDLWKRVSGKLGIKKTTISHISGLPDK